MRPIPRNAADFTTGHVARLCHVCARTVAMWTDSGMLSCWRIPGSQDRRIPRKALIAFMIRHELAMPNWLKEETKEMR